MKKNLSLLLIPVMAIGLTDLGSLSTNAYAATQTTSKAAVSTNVSSESAKQKQIEQMLNLANNTKQEWTYDKSADAWILSIVSAVAYPELPDQQGVSVCVPGAYVLGIDTNKDGKANITAKTYTKAIKGSLVINAKGKVTSTNGQIYTASTAPVILNTGAAGYGSQKNMLASTTHAADGYINIACGNRGKQDTVTVNGKTSYTGDAPSCLVDQKAAARFVKYNILLGNLPGNVNYFVSTGGSGGGAHATMFSATSNHEDFYDYQIAAGAVGVYKNASGSYSTQVTIKGKTYAISDGAWGTVAYSPITSLTEADMAMAFEYTLDSEHTFNTPFQQELAKYLSVSYMNYINDQNLSVKESAVGFDLNKDNDLSDTVSLKIQYDLAAHPDTNGYYGTYLDLYLAEFTENLQWYLNQLDYAKDWTWFDANGKALSNEQTANLTAEDKAKAFLEGRYTKPAANNKGMFGGGTPPAGMTGLPTGTKPTGLPTGATPGTTGGQMIVGTPNAGTTQSATSKVDSSTYKTYEEMLTAYKTDLAEIQAGDKYGNNLVSLYNPLNYIGAKGAQKPVWTRLVLGAKEGDISMFNALNVQIKSLNAGINTTIEWQWDGGHVPSETLSSSFSRTVDQMYGTYVKGAVKISTPKPVVQTTNGTSTTPTGTDISKWINAADLKHISFTLADIAAYRTSGASKATPGFDSIDYGQEDYVFGDSGSDARHWNIYLLEIFEKYAETLSPLFNKK